MRYGCQGGCGRNGDKNTLPPIINWPAAGRIVCVRTFSLEKKEGQSHRRDRNESELHKDRMTRRSTFGVSVLCPFWVKEVTVWKLDA